MTTTQQHIGESDVLRTPQRVLLSLNQRIAEHKTTVLRIASSLLAALLMAIATPASAQVLPPANDAPFRDAIATMPIFRWSTCGMGNIPCAEFDDPQTAARFIFDHTSSFCNGKKFGGISNYGNQVDGFYGVQWSGTDTNVLLDAMGRLHCDPSGAEVAIGNTAPLVWYCPEGLNMQSWTDPQVAGLFLACTKPAPVRTWCLGCDGLRSMQFGNPISVADGTKLQTEEDLRATTFKGLSFTRSFRSDMRGFLTEYTGTGLNPRLSTECLPVRYFSAGLNQWQMGCATHLSGWSEGYVYRNAANHYVSYQPSANGSTLNQRLGVAEQIVRMPDGSSMVRTPRNVLESFLPSGRLAKRAFAAGVEQSMVYSTAQTPSSVAPREGLLIGVVDSFGRSLSLTFDASSRLATMRGPDDGIYQYTTDSAGNVVQVRYPDGSTRQYRYNEPANTEGADLPFALTGIIDEKGIQFANFAYGANGFAKLTEHANGVDRHETSPLQVVLPEGQALTYQVGTFGRFMSPTRVTRSCPGCQTATVSYVLDNVGNPMLTKDWNGIVNCRAYDTSRTVVAVRVEGLPPQTTDCTPFMALGAVLPANSRKTSTEWHPDWRLETKLAEPGRLTTKIYNGQPDPFNGGAIASCAPATAVLPDGKPIVVLCKSVEQATTDVNGASGFNAALQSGVVAKTTTWTYNAVGQILTENGPRTDVSDVTTYTYYTATTADYTLGDLKTLTNAAGKVTTYNKYNKAGQLLQSTDPNGVVTLNTYDLRQRLKTATVGTQTTSYDYDPVGQLKKITQPDGSWLGYDYDDAHRQVAMYDNLGNRVDYTLDNAGNRTAETVKNNAAVLKRQLSRSIDALGRVQQTTGRE